MEEDHIVTIKEELIEHHRPDGLIERVFFNHLQAVVIETKDVGPFSTDVFWVLVGSVIDGEQQGCYISQGVTGGEELLIKLQQLPDFDNEKLIEAMSCAEEHQFVLWERRTA